MAKQVCYEWCFEVVDSNNDIVDSFFFERLNDLLDSPPPFEDGQRLDLCLIRREYHNLVEVDIQWAYVVDNILPTNFSDAYCNPTNAVIPKRLRVEFDRNS